MENRYDWKEIDEKTNSKARWAVTDCGTVFAFDKKPYYDANLGWCVDGLAELWEIGKTVNKKPWRFTLEERPENINNKKE